MIYFRVGNNFYQENNSIRVRTIHQSMQEAALVNLAKYRRYKFFKAAAVQCVVFALMKVAVDEQRRKNSFYSECIFNPQA